MTGLWIAVAVAEAYSLWRFHRQLYHIEPNRIEVTRHEVSCRDLDSALDGLVIAQVSDVHITPLVRNREAISAAIRANPADLYVFTGDLIQGPRGVEAFAAWFESMGDAVRPAVAVLGNAEHKRYISTLDAVNRLRDLGITLLMNEAVSYEVRGAHLQIVGVDDPHTRHSRFDQAYASAQPDRFTLLLSHSPDGVAEMGSVRADLMLCGHTHGGQIRFPGSKWLTHNTKKVRGLVSGWYESEALSRAARSPRAGVRMYVSRGLGCSRFGGRFNCPPELALFTLRADSASS